MVHDTLPRHAAVVIVGGGVMGVSAAYHLAKGGQPDVLLLERSDLLGQGATGKCAGGIRHQFGTEVNIRLSIESIHLLENFEDEPGQQIDLHQCGYLFLLTNHEDVVAFEHNVALQRKLGTSFHFWRSEGVLDRLNPRAEALLDAVGLTGFAEHTAASLPYGRKRALEIATTLALDPEMMLLDEPMSGLGQEDIGRISGLIRQVARDRTVLMVEHNLSVVADLSDTITVLTRGSILAEGDYATVSRNPQVVQAYLGQDHA